MEREDNFNYRPPPRVFYNDFEYTPPGRRCTDSSLEGQCLGQAGQAGGHHGLGTEGSQHTDRPSVSDGSRVERSPNDELLFHGREHQRTQETPYDDLVNSINERRPQGSEISPPQNISSTSNCTTQRSEQSTSDGRRHQGTTCSGSSSSSRWTQGAGRRYAESASSDLERRNLCQSQTILGQHSQNQQAPNQLNVCASDLHPSPSRESQQRYQPSLTLTEDYRPPPRTFHEDFVYTPPRSVSPYANDPDPNLSEGQGQGRSNEDQGQSQSNEDQGQSNQAQGRELQLDQGQIGQLRSEGQLGGQREQSEDQTVQGQGERSEPAERNLDEELPSYEEALQLLSLNSGLQTDGERIEEQVEQAPPPTYDAVAMDLRRRHTCRLSPPPEYSPTD